MCEGATSLHLPGLQVLRCLWARTSLRALRLSGRWAGSPWGGRAAHAGLSCLHLLLFGELQTYLLAGLWYGVMDVTSACPLLSLVLSSTSMGTLKGELSTSQSWMPRRRL